jgi:hypothetical protein
MKRDDLATRRRCDMLSNILFTCEMQLAVDEDPQLPVGAVGLEPEAADLRLRHKGTQLEFVLWVLFARSTCRTG